jgi:carboxyl-terminal processing protease
MAKISTHFFLKSGGECSEKQKIERKSKEKIGYMKRIAALALTVVTFATASAQSITINETQMRKLQQAEFFIKNNYVDNLEDEKIVDAAIEGMLKQLDPHSTYIKAKDVEKTNENLNGSFEGIGVQFQMVEDTLVVIKAVSGGPCEKQGIIPGDRIVFVNDSTIAGVKMTNADIMTRLRGPKGSVVKLGIIRPGVKGINNFNIIRDKIPVYTVDASYMVSPGIGYIRIDSFGATTYDEFMTAIKSLKDQGMQRLIIDLQSNGGGYLQTAVRLANEFFPKGEKVLSQKGNKNVNKAEYNYLADGTGTLKDLPVVVLVDSYSASASEILSGAFQDNDRGLIVGRRTYGKGLVQRPIELIDKSVIRLTTAHYYTPSGRCIQKPYEMGNKKDYQKDIEDRLNSGELTNIDSIHFADSLKFYTTHLQREVYGGGGIMPDYYVPLDTTLYSKLHRELSAKGCINAAVLRYMDKNRKDLKKKYKTITDFKSRFQPGDDIFSLLKTEAQKSKVEYKEEDFTATKSTVGKVVKALIGRDLWEINAYYELYNENNPIYVKGVEVISSEQAVNIMKH